MTLASRYSTRYYMSDIKKLLLTWGELFLELGSSQYIVLLFTGALKCCYLRYLKVFILLDAFC